MNVNERNSLEYFSSIKYFRLHRQLEALTSNELESLDYPTEFTRYYVNRSAINAELDVNYPPLREHMRCSRDD